MDQELQGRSKCVPEVAGGGSRDSHSRAYLSRIVDGDLPMDAEIREILRPLKAEIIEALRLSISTLEEPNDLPNGWDQAIALLVRGSVSS